MTLRRVLVAVVWMASLAAGAAHARQGSGGQAQNVLVLPFENAGRNPRLDWIGEGLAELSAERLAGEGRTVFSREERLAAVERIGLVSSSRFSRATMLKLAAEADADYVVFGSYTSDGKTLTATARVLRVEPLGLSEPLAESGPIADLMEIHARVAWGVLQFVDSAIPVTCQAFLSSFERPRLDAFEQYIRGLAEAKEDLRRRYWREAARLAPDWSPPALALGLDSYERRDCSSALNWFSRISPGQRGATEALFYGGLCYLQRNDPARAETAFAAIVARARPPGEWRAEALNNLGVARARQEKWREAAAVWQQAQLLDPGEPDYSFNLGLAALRNNEPTAAVRFFRETLRRKPDDAVARVSLVAALERSGRATEAASERESAGTSNVPPAPRLKTALSAPISTGTRRSASSNHRAAHLQLHLSRGRDFLAAGKMSEAQREFSEAVLIAPESVEAHVGLAEALERQGRRDDAIQELRAALKLEPSNIPARRMLERIESGSERGGHR